MPVTYTPLRFPGGKSKIYPFMVDLLKANDLLGCAYAEPFCGGAGLAMAMLLKGNVSRVILNDLDPAVYSVWNAVLEHTDELCDFISTVPLDVGEWERQRKIYLSEKIPSLELGCAAFYLNRTNRSGILGARPIGGLNQEGRYGIGARFNRVNLRNKILAIATRRDDIALHNYDAMDFMANVAPSLGKKSLVYLDPPYVRKGPGLYENSFDESDHRELANCIRGYRGKWMVTYDTDPLIDSLYVPDDGWDIWVGGIDVRYCAASKRPISKERLVLGPGLVMPSTQRENGIDKAC